MKKGLFINLITESDRSDIALPKVLAVFKGKGMKSYWKIEKNAEACGNEICERIHEYSDSGEIITGNELYHLLTPSVQIIEGWLEAFNENTIKPWLIIQVKDGSCIDIVSIDENIYEEICKIYTKASYHPAIDLIGKEL
jgi:hypothetical protein